MSKMDKFISSDLKLEVDRARVKYLEQCSHQAHIELQYIQDEVRKKLGGDPDIAQQLARGPLRLIIPAQSSVIENSTLKIIYESLNKVFIQYTLDRGMWILILRIVPDDTIKINPQTGVSLIEQQNLDLAIEVEALKKKLKVSSSLQETRSRIDLLTKNTRDRITGPSNHTNLQSIRKRLQDIKKKTLEKTPELGGDVSSEDSGGSSVASDVAATTIP